MRTDRGQAAVEFIIGLFALVMIVSTFLLLGRILPVASKNLGIVRLDAGLAAMNARESSTCSLPPAGIISSRLEAGGAPYVKTPVSTTSHSFEVDVGDFLTRHVFGEPKFRMTESAAIPIMNIPRGITREGEAE